VVARQSGFGDEETKKKKEKKKSKRGKVSSRQDPNVQVRLGLSASRPLGLSSIKGEER